MAQKKLHQAFGWESGARSYSRGVPNVFSRASGAYVYDRDGKPYLDFLCAAGTLLLGHNHPAIMTAIANTTDPFMSHLDLRTEAEEDFVKTLLPLLPFEDPAKVKIHFCSPSGGDAVEAALKLAVRNTGRKGVIAFAGAYHGMGQGALSVTSNKQIRESSLRMLGDVTFMPFPYPYRFPAPFNTDETATEFCLAQLKLVLEDDHSGVNLPAAIIIEPIQGEGGNVIAPRRFMKELRDICTQYGIVMICDEIQAGLGRTGKWFSSDHYDVKPDIVCVSKGIGGGFPMALIAFDEKLNVWKPGTHIGTFRGQQFSMTCGKALLDTIQNENLLDNSATRGRQFVDGLTDLQSRFNQIGQIRGQGLYVGIEMNRALGDPGVLAQSLKTKLYDRGIIVECGGREGSVIRTLAPLNTSEEIAAHFLNNCEDSLKEMSAPKARKSPKRSPA